MISVLYDDDSINNIYFLFSHKWKKIFKKQRMGLLYSIGVVVVYLDKKDASIYWNEEEIKILEKIDDIHFELYKEVKNKLKKPVEKQKKEEINGLDYLIKYIPYTYKD